MKRALALLLAFSLTATGCTDKQRALFCKTLKTVNAIENAVNVALPLLAPQLAAEYRLLAGAVDVAKAPLMDGCTGGGTEALDDAADSAIALLAWWQQHGAEVRAASNTRDVAPDDSADVLAKLQAYRREQRLKEAAHAFHGGGL